jgi:hypothetical protein
MAKQVKVIITRDGVLVGEGRWTEDCEIVACLAVLGPDQDASDETYEALCDELANLDQSEDTWRGPVAVERPDATYEAELELVETTKA